MSELEADYPDAIHSFNTDDDDTPFYIVNRGKDNKSENIPPNLNVPDVK